MSEPKTWRVRLKPRALLLPKMMDWDEDAGAFTYDEGYARKRPDWTYAPVP
jgi:hypothetical protein